MCHFLCWFLGLFCVALLPAREISANLFNGLKWRLIGPFRGGRAVAVAGVAGGGSTFYFGSVGGGIWKTTDAGMVWTPIFDGQPVGSIGALEIAPSDPNVIYAGTGESDIRSDLASGDGVYKSTDAGRTWSNVGLKETRQISRIVIDPRDPNIVFVAALGHAYAPNEERGIFKSVNGGQTWEKALNRGPNVGAADLATAADEPSVLFAAMWEAHRPPWSTYAPLSGPGSGLYRSTDAGKTWQLLTANGLPSGTLGRIGVAIARGTHGKRIYASIEADAKNSGIYRSDDGGDTWSRVNADSRITSRAWYFSCITVDPNNPDVLYVPNVALYKLSDGGKSLSIVRGAPGGDDYHQLWIDPANSAHMVLGTDQGTTVSLNGGATWSSWYNQPTAQFYHVVADNDLPYHVYGSQQDSGTAATASRTDRSQIDARDWFTVGGSESGYIAIDPKDQNIFYISGTYGSVERFDRRMSQSQNIAPWPMPPGIGSQMPERKFRDPWTPVLVVSPIPGNGLYLGTQYVMKTLDGGLHWQTISPDLTGGGPKSPAMAEGPPTVDNARERGYGVVYTIAPSFLSPSEIWAGSDTGLIHLTRDGGKIWSNVTPTQLSPWSKITLIETSHFTPGEAYAAVDRHRIDDMRPYLYRTRDFGKTWTPIAEGIADHAFLNAIREDPKRKGLLFAGTEFGVYVSFNDGDKWLPLQLNLPVTSVRDLAVHNNDLVIATHGRSFWVLDDISPLRQIKDDEGDPDVMLYKPARALRTTSDSFLGTPVPPEEPQAGNPPRGAYIDYYLAKPASGPVVLDILDMHGTPVRHFSSRDKPPDRPRNAPIAPRWFLTPPQLSEDAGMHRLIWDLRYGRTGDIVPAAEDTGERVLGPLVLPGSYKLKFQANGSVSMQMLQVAMDPRSHATNTELLVQFRWAQRVFESMIRARKAVAELQKFQVALAADKNHVGEDRKSLLDAIAKLNEASGDLLTGKGQGTDQGLETVSRALTIALNGFENADRMPPSQLIDFYRQFETTLNSRLAEWNRLKRSAIPELNQQLQNAGADPIQVGQ